MALSSMTGFARTGFEAEGAKFAWELKSVNGRGLELRLRLPPGFDHLETRLRAMVRDRLARGSCQFALLQEGGSGEARLTLNEEALALVVAAARRLAAIEGVGMPTADGLLAIPGVLVDRGRALAEDALEQRDAAVTEAFGVALAALGAARAEEGGRLTRTLQDQLAAVADLVDQAEAIAAAAPATLKERIREQVELLAGGNLDPERLHQEALLAVTRADVREEIDRLCSHITGAEQLIASSAAVGRRLEFLAQEFNREANTLCSKAFDKRLTAVGLELKAVIDQFREQVQNIE
jgi:uncharacterized protein (TIGR00255 family)